MYGCDAPEKVIYISFMKGKLVCAPPQCNYWDTKKENLGVVLHSPKSGVRVWLEGDIKRSSPRGAKFQP